MTEKNWYTADELKGLPGLPQAASSISRKATKEGWAKRQMSGVKGVAYEYPYDALPKETQEFLGQNGAEGLSNQSDNHDKKCRGDYPEGFDFQEEFALIPGYKVQVSAGHGSLAGSDSKPTRYLAFRRKWLKYRGFCEKDLVVVWAKGDSMEPTIHSNDTLIVHMGRNKPQDGHMYIFRNGEELFVKRYQSALGTWRLISDNSVYPPLDIVKEDQHQFEIIGQVVHVAKDFGD